MNLTESPGDLSFRVEVRAWLESVLPEVWGGPQRPETIKEEDDYAMRRRFDEALTRDGWAGLSWSPEYGGQGRSLRDQIIFAEESERAGAPEIFNRVGIGIIAHAIMLHGSSEQKARFLPQILTSEEIWCQGFSEPGAGSDLASLQTRAVLVDDQWVISGQKVWTTLAPFADLCLVLARTEPDAPRHKGISAFLVDMDRPGVEVRPVRQINGDNEFAEVFFDEVTVPPDALLGDRGHGWNIAMAALEFERSTNFMRRQVRLAVLIDGLTSTCRQAHRHLPTSLLDGVVDLVVRSECLRFTVWRNVTMITESGRPGPLTNASKVYWSETYQRFARLAYEVDAALAEHDPGNHRQAMRRVTGYLTARAATIYAGTSEIQRNIVAERGLGLPR